MKFKYLYILALASLFTVTSCTLDESLGGDLVSDETISDISGKDPAKVSALINGISSSYIKYNSIGNRDHDDFGYAAICQYYEMNGQDFMAPDNGYNWFSAGMNYRDRTLTSDTSLLMWIVFYNVIKASNDVIGLLGNSIDNATEADKANLQMYLAQGYANRAFAYFQLIQTYQFTYVGNQDKPGVPLVLVQGDERAKGTRASVEEVYNVITTDINKAIELLEASGKAVPNKSYVSLNVAYGLKARISLVMENWKDAAEFAKKAQSGHTPYSKSDISKPGLNDSNASSWMWANLITEENDIVQTGIINWPSHLSSFTGNGYTTVGAYRSASKEFWDKIATNDIRKNSWWVDGDKKAPYTDNIIVKKGTDEGPIAEVYGYLPYTNIKFGPYQNLVLNTLNATDWVMMRVEEMILIEAEALVMQNKVAEGKAILTNFLNTYRYKDGTSYETSASSAKELQDEIWLQRRIELWGEGFALLDIKRLKKDVIRVNENKESSYPARARFNVKADLPNMLYLLPQKEIEASSELTQADNNEIGKTLDPII